MGNKLENKKSVTCDFTEGKLFSKMVLFIIPFVLANLLQTLYTVTDLAIVGHFGGSHALAAVSVGGELTVFMTLVGTSLGSSAQIYVSQLLGQKRKEDLNAAIGTLITFVTAVSVIILLAGIFFARSFLSLLNTPENAMEEAMAYVQICSVGMIFVYGYNGVCAVLRGLGQSRAPTVFVAVTAFINVLGDLLLVYVFQMGAAGAAIATVTSQLIAFLCSLVYLYRFKDEIGFDFKPKSFLIQPEHLGVIMKLAAPLVTQQLAVQLSMLYVSSCINSYGEAAASIAGIGNKLYSVMTMVSGAILNAMATVTGQNIGARNTGRVVKALRISLCCSMSFFVIIAFVVLVFPEAVFSVFTNDAEVMALSAHYLRIAVWAYLCFALMHPVFGLIQGVGNTTLTMVIGILDGVVARIGLSLYLGSRLGMWGYFWGFCLAGSVTVILSWLYYFTGRWKNRKLL